MKKILIAHKSDGVFLGLNRRIAVYVFVSILVPGSCNRIKDKGQELAHRTEEKVKTKSLDLIDHIVPQFDADRADTKFNRERFSDFLQVERTPDVKNIYCFDDAIGIDADYQFAFNCDPSTARRIIEKHHLTLDTVTTDYGFGMQTEFDWWDTKKIEQLPLYSRQGNRQFFQYFWYDEQEGKAYFFDFDL